MASGTMNEINRIDLVAKCTSMVDEFNLAALSPTGFRLDAFVESRPYGCRVVVKLRDRNEMDTFVGQFVWRLQSFLEIQFLKLFLHWIHEVYANHMVTAQSTQHSQYSQPYSEYGPSPYYQEGPSQDGQRLDSSSEDEQVEELNLHLQLAGDTLKEEESD